MRIQHFTQGEKTDRELFGLVGPAIIDPAVHEQLSMPVTGKPGDLGWVATSRGRLLGFAQVRRQRKGSHIRYLWAIDEPSRDELLRSVLAFLQQQPTVIYTNDRQGSTVWPSQGFVLVRPPTRGEFGCWELPLAPVAEAA